MFTESVLERERGWGGGGGGGVDDKHCTLNDVHYTCFTHLHKHKLVEAGIQGSRQLAKSWPFYT